MAPATLAELRAYLECGGRRDVVRVEGSAIALSLLELSKSRERLIVLVASDEEAESLRFDLRALAPGTTALVLPERSENPYEMRSYDRRAALARAACLSRFDEKRLSILIATSSSFSAKVPSRKALAPHLFSIRVGDELSLDALAERLAFAGYDRLPLVEDPGAFAIRGSIVDVWPPGEATPTRLELSFDAVERISPFLPDSQRTLPEIRDSLSLVAATEVPLTSERKARAVREIQSLCDELEYPSKQTRKLLLDVESGRNFFGHEAMLPAYEELESLAERLGERDSLVLVEPGRVVGALEAHFEFLERAHAHVSGEPSFPPSRHSTTPTEFALQSDRLESSSLVLLHRLAIHEVEPTRGLARLSYVREGTPSLDSEDQSGLSLRLSEARKRAGKAAGLDPLLEEFRLLADKGRRVVVTARQRSQAERLATLLEHRGVSLRFEEKPDLFSAEPGFFVTVAPLARGVTLPAENLTLVTEEEIFGKRSHVRPKSSKRALKNVLDDLRSLTPGDLVVHTQHGVGRYQGLVHKTIDGVTVDLILVEYSGTDRLLLPVYRLDQLQKLPEGSAGAALDRLGGASFEKVKSRARKKVREITDQLLRLYAERQARLRPPIPPLGDEYEAFAAQFPFEETEDQAAAIVDVITDLQKDSVMDRLVCGDVGFGKTEVALRATLLVALAGRQVAILCPTTVLADQHKRTFVSRLEESGIIVAGLSRFETPSDVKKTLEGLKKGTIDVVIGTHRLLSKDVHFKDLGLLVIDEEQRFGVAHKERMKELRTHVDALTLTATPIPRTLSFALGGLRDMSVIATPPENRRAIRTTTSRYDTSLIAGAITREVERGGQVFFVRNRVEGIEERAAELRRLLPGIRIAVGHGQMSESALEKVMLAFSRGEFDVLVATTIVESGLDIPRANTILIERADTFGLSQLYQIRGRVGRSSERAYCYLLLPPEGEITDEARLRLLSLERHSELGAGFQIATLDLEQRGAGELLGADQSGFLGNIGLDLYLELVEQARAELTGEPYKKEVDPDLSVDVEALLPESYIADIGVRLSLYKRLSGAEDEAEVRAIGEELVDRFGEPPEPALHFLELMRQKTELRRFKALGVVATRRTVVVHLSPDTPLTPEALVTLIGSSRGTTSLSPDGRLTRKASEPLPKNGLLHAALLLDELARLA